jgi:hypothetical protein
MRPITKQNGNYWLQERANFLPMGRSNPNRILALCCEFERERLDGIVNGIGGATQAIKNAIIGRIAAIAGPWVDTGLGAIPAVPAAFVGGNYFQALNTIPVANRTIVDRLAHYDMILRNLDYDIANNAFGFANHLNVSDIPYASSAILDATEALRGAGGANRLIGYDDNLVRIAIPGAGPAMVNEVSEFSLANVRDAYNKLLGRIETDANRANTLPYNNAATELVQNSGPYCAYCEANLKTQIDVEHMLPKGKGATVNGIRQGFSALAKEWRNFVPACPRCNSTKNAAPNKIQLSTWGTGLPFTKDDQRVLGGNIALAAGPAGDRRINDWENLRLAPNVAQFPLEPGSFRQVGFRLMYFNGFAFVVENANLAALLQLSIAGVFEGDKAVQVNIPAGVNAAGGVALAARQVFYRLEIDTNGTAGLPVFATPGPAAARNKVDRMVNICGLNATNANTDRRLLERTEAFFLALRAYGSLHATLGTAAVNTNALRDLVFANWMQGLVTTIKEKGFFSVWMKVFFAISAALVAANAGAGTPAGRAGHPLAGRGTVPQFPNPLVGNEVGGAAPNAFMTLAQHIADTMRQDPRLFPGTNWSQIP